MAAGWITGCGFSGAAEFNLHAHLFLRPVWTGDGPVPPCRRTAYHDECQMLVKQAPGWMSAQPPPVITAHRRRGPENPSRNPSDFRFRVDILLSRKRMRRCWVTAVSICAGLRAGIALTIFMWLEELGFTYLYTTERRMNKQSSVHSVLVVSTQREP